MKNALEWIGAFFAAMWIIFTLLMAVAFKAMGNLMLRISDWFNRQSDWLYETKTTN